MHTVLHLHTDDCCVVVAIKLDGPGYAIITVGHELAVDLRLEPTWIGADLVQHLRAHYGLVDLNDPTWFVVECDLDGLETIEVGIGDLTREYIVAA